LLAVTTGDAISGPWGAIDMTGKMVIPEQFGDHFQFSDGLAAVAEAAVRPKLHGYTDRNGKLVLPFQFETAMPFRNGVAWAKKDKRWQIIDKTGKVLFQE
jgi:WG containing repeat